MSVLGSITVELDCIHRGINALSERLDAVERKADTDAYTTGFADGYVEGLADFKATRTECLFTYLDVPRRGFVVDVVPSARGYGFNVLVEETFNTRDGRHPEPVLKSFHSSSIKGFEKVD